MLVYVLQNIWNNRIKYQGIIIEQIIVFILLLLCMVEVLSTLNKYAIPGNLNVKNVLIFACETKNKSNEDKSIIQNTFEQVINRISKGSGVVASSKCSMFSPFLRSDNSFKQDSILIDGVSYAAYIKGADQSAMSVFCPEVLYGAWQLDKRLDDGSIPALITKQLADKLNLSNPIGKKIQNTPKTIGDLTIVGVIAGLKNELFVESSCSLIIPAQFIMDHPSYEYCVRVNSEHLNAIQIQFYKEFDQLFDEEDVYPLVFSLESFKNEKSSWNLIGIYLQSVPTLFLLFFAFLGTFGLFWINSKKRSREYALWIALGARKIKLISMTLLESLVITIISTIPGILVFLSVYEYSLVNCLGLAGAFTMILIFSMVSAILPAISVLKLSPSQALRAE